MLTYTHQKIKLPFRAFVGVVNNKLKRASFACWSKDTTRANEENRQFEIPPAGASVSLVPVVANFNNLFFQLFDMFQRAS